MYIEEGKIGTVTNLQRICYTDMTMDEVTTIQQLKDILRKFRDERDWEKFHDPKNIASAISIEAGELQELFLWKDKDEINRKIETDPIFRKKVEDELSDVFNYCLDFANAVGIDIAKTSIAKIEENGKKYPVEKAKGVATKYNEL